jgi:hypothetical protein
MLFCGRGNDSGSRRVYRSPQTMQRKPGPRIRDSHSNSNSAFHQAPKNFKKGKDHEAFVFSGRVARQEHRLRISLKFIFCAYEALAWRQYCLEAHVNFVTQGTARAERRCYQPATGPNGRWRAARGRQPRRRRHRELQTNIPPWSAWRHARLAKADGCRDRHKRRNAAPGDG